MADTIKGKLQEAGHAISETAKKVSATALLRRPKRPRTGRRRSSTRARTRPMRPRNKAENEAKEANTDAKEKSDNCGCG